MAAVVVVSTSVVAALALRPGPDSQADGRLVCGDRVSIAADPKIAPVVAEVVDDLATGECLSVGVQEVPAAKVARDVARKEGRGLGEELPDLWIADSSIWLERAAESSEGAERLAGRPMSVATTPVVVAMSKQQARAMGWPETQPSWRRMLSSPRDEVRLGLTDLGHDAAALASAAAAEATGGKALADVAASVAVPRSVVISSIDLIDDRTADAAPSTEQEVFTNSEQKNTRAVVASYDESLGSLDFPLTAVAALGEEPATDVIQVHDRLVAALDGEQGQALLSAHGLRDHNGAAVAPLTESDVVDATTQPGTAAHDTAALREASEAWTGLSRRSRLVMAMDMSGSMAEELPGSRQTRDQAAQAGLSALISGFPPDNEVGLWGFTTEIGNGNYRVFTSLGRLSGQAGRSTRREDLLRGVRELDAVPGGSTSLYDTIEAAYRVASKRYAFGKFNAVVVLTDGRNEDPGSISLRQLIDSLRKRFDGTKPVRIVTIAYGRDADTTTLRRIANATAGRSYNALTETEISSAIARLAANES